MPKRSISGLVSGRHVGSWRRFCVLAAGAIAALVTTAAYASEVERRANDFEITPFFGYMAGGGFEDPVLNSDRDLDADNNWGAIFNATAGDDWRHYEVLYSNQSTQLDGVIPVDMDVQYLQIGGIVSHPEATRVIPYFGLTVGATQLSPDGPGLDDETKLSFSAAGGMRIPITDHIGVRFDARVYMTLLDTEGDIFCVSSAGATCRIQAKSDTFVQYSATLGLIIGF